MTISIFATGTPAFANNANATASLGGTTVINDIAAAWGVTSSAGTGRTVATPAGYTLDKSDTSVDISMYEWHKVAGAAEGNPVLVPAGMAAGDEVGAVGMIYRGVDPANVVHVSSSQGTASAGSGTPINVPALTVTNANCLIVLYLAWAANASAFGTYNPNADGAWSTMVPFVMNSTGTRNLSIQVFYRIQTSAANISASSVSITTAQTGTGRAHIVAYNNFVTATPQPIVPGAKQTFITETIWQF